MTHSSHVEPILLTSEEVASLLRIKVRTVQALARGRQLPGARRVGKQWRFLRSAIMEYLEDPAPWQLSTNDPEPRSFGSDIGTVRKKYDDLLALKSGPKQRSSSLAV